MIYFGCYNVAVIRTWIRSGFQLSVVKPKPKQLVWPITTDVNNTTSQSDLEANTCNWHQAREKACGENTNGFGLDSPLVEKVARVFNQ